MLDRPRGLLPGVRLCDIINVANAGGIMEKNKALALVWSILEAHVDAVRDADGRIDGNAVAAALTNARQDLELLVENIIDEFRADIDSALADAEEITRDPR